MSSFEDYARTNLPALLRLAAVLSRDRQTAEDVVQEVLFRVSQRWDQVSAQALPDAYVRRMIVNEYLSWRRKWARITPHAEIDSGGVAADHADTLADREEMALRLRALPPRQRAVLVLRYYEGMYDEQIAETLGCSPGAVRTAVSRALATLRVEHAETFELNQKEC